MKIASLVCAYPPYAGGIGNSAVQINTLLEDRHEITVFTPANLRPLLKYGHSAFSPGLFFRLHQFDALYLHYPFFGTNEIVWLFKIFHKKTKLILHYHMDVKNRNILTRLLSLPSRLILPSLLNQAETIVTASLDYIKESQIKKYYARHPEKFQEIPFGRDLTKFKPKVVSEPQDNRIIKRAKEIVHYINDKFIKRDRLNLLFVGGLDRAHYFKGLENLLQALVIVSPRSWRLKIVGGGELKPYYQELTNHLKLEKQVEFCGRLDDERLIRSFQEADLFILPSINRNEAFGIVLVEALACGVPVLASNLPGVRRVFRDQQEGLVFTPGDINDLKDKLEFILKNENIRRQMAQAARKLAEDKYDLAKMKIRLEKLFS